MSWHTCKSYSPEENEKKIFEYVLKKCGKFLTRLNLCEFNQIEDDINISIIANECPNLIDIDLGHCSKKSIELIKPIFHNVEEFRIFVKDVDDADLEKLLMLNKKLKTIRICIRIPTIILRSEHRSNIRGRFLQALPKTASVHLSVDSLEDTFDINNTLSVPFLKTLRMYSLPLTDIDLIRIASHCLELEVVELNGELLRFLINKNEKILTSFIINYIYIYLY